MISSDTKKAKMLTYTTAIQHCLEVIAREISQEKEIKVTHIRKV